MKRLAIIIICVMAIVGLNVSLVSAAPVELDKLDVSSINFFGECEWHW